MVRSSAAVVVALALMYVLSCGAPSGSPVSPTAVEPNVLKKSATIELPPPPRPPVPDAVFTGAGDIADCHYGSEETAELLDRIPGSIFTLGDNAYPSATAQTLNDCFEPTWGRHGARTHPTSGNHDWSPTKGAAAYFDYFGAAAGPAGVGYYSFDLGAWHILSLNSNITAKTGSAEYEWARRDLETHPSDCSLAYWHHPVFSSGEHGDDPHMHDVWRMLEDNGVDVVLAGHDHSYERFAPQDADGHIDPNGIREFVVGTGGVPTRSFKGLAANSEMREDKTLGVLELTLHESSYDWQFVPVQGGAFRDAGSGECVHRH